MTKIHDPRDLKNWHVSGFGLFLILLLRVFVSAHDSGPLTLKSHVEFHVPVSSLEAPFLFFFFFFCFKSYSGDRINK